jgi:hypothetical protein
MQRYVFIGLWLLLIAGLLYAAYWIVPGLLSYRDVMAISDQGVPAELARRTLQATFNAGLPGIAVSVIAVVGLFVARWRLARR